MTAITKKSRLLVNRFIRLIEESHQEITERFMNDLLKNPDTVAYRSLDPAMIYEMGDMVYRDLSKWIDNEFPKKKIEERYTKLARERLASGVPFYQVQKALTLQKRQLWLFVMDKLYDDNIMYIEALELNNRVTLYFDRALFYLLKAYHELLTSEI